MMNTQHSVDAFLAQSSFALVGVSRTGEKFGNVILRTLTEKGMRIYPLHPVLDTVDGMHCYRHFGDMPEPVGGVIICVAPAEAVSVVRDAADAGIRHVWLQQGAESPCVANLCIELGLDAVLGACILMFANPTGVHRFHRTVDGVLGRLPK